jgi:NAD(P)-dependent dehydrogenase (short-subunit alcohol dehydrogenase family)
MKSHALQGKTALVTGAAEGIGQGVAQRLAKDGAMVLVADFNQELGQKTTDDLVAAGGQARFIPVDITDKASVMAMMKAAGPVDILINNAWRGQGMGRIEKKTDEQFETTLRMGLFACQWTMQAALPHMKAQRWGRVINMASLNGVNAHMGSADYNVSKEALRALTRTAAREWAPYGICCNIVCPAALSASARRVMEHQPGMIERISAANPMGRMGDPEADIGGVCAFLASEDARYLTGNTLFVDGGAHINGVAWAPDLGED